MVTLHTRPVEVVVGGIWSGAGLGGCEGAVQAVFPPAWLADSARRQRLNAGENCGDRITVEPAHLPAHPVVGESGCQSLIPGTNHVPRLGFGHVARIGVAVDGRIAGVTIGKVPVAVVLDEVPHYPVGHVVSIAVGAGVRCAERTAVAGHLVGAVEEVAGERARQCAERQHAGASRCPQTEAERFLGHRDLICADRRSEVRLRHFGDDHRHLVVVSVVMGVDRHRVARPVAHDPDAAGDHRRPEALLRPVERHDLGCGRDRRVGVREFGDACQTREVRSCLVCACVLVEARGVDGEGGRPEDEQHRSGDQDGRGAALLGCFVHDSYLDTAVADRSTETEKNTKSNW